MIREFGALVNTQATTLRKLFTIVYTEVVNPKPGSAGLIMNQWLCVLLVFVGLYIGEQDKGDHGKKQGEEAQKAAAPAK